MDQQITKKYLQDNEIPQNTLTIIGALEELGDEVADKGSEISAEFIELFGKKIISFTSEFIEDIIQYTFPNIENRSVQEITDELKKKLKMVIEVIKIMASDEELNKDVNDILQLVSVTATTMIRTIVADLKQPIEESIDDIQESSQKIIVKLVQGTVRTTWNAFLAALDAVPFLGEIGGLINLASSVVKTGVEIAPPIIKNFGTFVDIVNKSAGSVLDITDNSIDSFNKISKKGNDIRNKISEIEQRVARKIQSATDGIKQLGSKPLGQLPSKSLGQLPSKSLGQLPSKSLGQLSRRYNPQVGGKKSKKNRHLKKKTRKQVIV